MKKKSKLLIAIFVVLFLIVATNVGIVVYINSNLKPTNAFLNGEICKDEGPCEVTPFEIEEGSYGLTTLQKLEEEGIIPNADIAYYWNRIFGGYSFYAGYYEIPHEVNGQKMTLEGLCDYLSNTENCIQDTITVKLDEGDFAKSFAEVIAESLDFRDIDSNDPYEKAQAILNYWNDENVIRSYMNEYPFITEEMFNSDSKVLVEGYLFPDTYEFFNNTTLDKVTRKIFDRTLSIYEKNILDFENSKLSTHEIFTLASIVQWETGDPEDSMLVAGAFLNRIDNPEFEGTGGKLQSTVTACYAFDLTKDECDSIGDASYITEEYDEYNTYTVEGFPPGPVCCPNEISINAALHPDQEAGYYFFVANMCEGGTAFAKTFAQHNANISKYYLPCSY